MTRISLSAMSPWTLQFRSASVEARYLANYHAILRRQGRVELALGAFAWAAFSVYDYAFWRDHLATITLVRHGIGTAGILLAFAILSWARPSQPRLLHFATLFGHACVLAATLAIYALCTVTVTPVLFAGLSIIVLGGHAMATSRLIVVAPLTLSAVAAYFVIGVVAGVPVRTLTYQGAWLVTAEVLALFVNYSIERLTRVSWDQQRIIAVERDRSDVLLHSMLPGPIAERLKRGESPIAERSEGVTVLFADIVGFTSLSQAASPEEVVTMLDRIFRDLDGIAKRHGLEKVKTIGDAYMAVAGLPTPRADHARMAAEAALEMREVLRGSKTPGGARLSMRIGLHSGPVVAGVIGTQKPTYDIWGDTVNTASRMESHGLPDEIQVSEAVALALGASFELRLRGEIDVKGKGRMTTWWLGASAK